MRPPRLMRLFTILSVSTAFLGHPASGISQKNVVAIVNGEAVTDEQLNSAIAAQLEAITTQISALKQSGLSKLIDNLLIEQAAKATGVSVAEYLSTHVEQITVSASEVDDAYERSKNQLPATLAPEAKYRIRRSLEDSRRADAMRTLLLDLRRKAAVRNLLLEDLSSNLNLEDTKGPFLGNLDAPVTIVEFGDFECPFCRTASPLVRRALERWPRKVRFVFKHFPLPSHPNALGIARGSVCAERDGRFWEFHDRVFEQDGSGLDNEALLTLAVSMGLDSSRFSQCMRAVEVDQTIQKDISIGRAAGVNSTPTFFVNKRRLNNAAELDGAIQEAISRVSVVERQ